MNVIDVCRETAEAVSVPVVRKFVPKVMVLALIS